MEGAVVFYNNIYNIIKQKVYKMQKYFYFFSFIIKYNHKPFKLYSIYIFKVIKRIYTLIAFVLFLEFLNFPEFASFLFCHEYIILKLKICNL
jgi:hypothetical protein